MANFALLCFYLYNLFGFQNLHHALIAKMKQIETQKRKICDENLSAEKLKRVLKGLMHHGIKTPITLAWKLFQ